MDPKSVSATHAYHMWPVCLKEWESFKDTKTWPPANLQLCDYGLTSSSNSRAQEKDMKSDRQIFDANGNLEQSRILVGKPPLSTRRLISGL